MKSDLIKTSDLELSSRVSFLERNQDWETLISIMEDALINEPNHPWLLTQMGYALMKYGHTKEGISYCRRAYKKNIRDPLFIYNYALALDECQRHEEARGLWKKLLAMNIDEVAFGASGEGMRHAHYLTISSIADIGLSYGAQGKFALAKKWLQRHLEQRRSGIPSAYPKAYILRKIRDFQT